MIIDDRQRETIFAQLREKGKWTGRRNGCRVRFWKRLTEQGIKIGYQLSRRNRTVSGLSATLAQAAEEVNAVLEGRPPKNTSLLVIPYDRLKLRYPERERLKD